MRGVVSLKQPWRVKAPFRATTGAPGRPTTALAKRREEKSGAAKRPNERTAMATSTMERSDVPGPSTPWHGGGRRTHRLLYRGHRRRREDSMCTPRTPAGHGWISRPLSTGACSACRAKEAEQGPLGRVDVSSTVETGPGVCHCWILLDAPTPILRCTCIWHLGWRHCANATRAALTQRWRSLPLEG